MTSRRSASKRTEIEPDDQPAIEVVAAEPAQESPRPIVHGLDPERTIYSQPAPAPARVKAVTVDRHEEYMEDVAPETGGSVEDGKPKQDAKPVAVGQPLSDVDLLLEQATENPQYSLRVDYLPDFELDGRADPQARRQFCAAFNPPRLDMMNILARKFPEGGEFLFTLNDRKGTAKRWHDSIKPEAKPAEPEAAAEQSSVSRYAEPVGDPFDALISQATKVNKLKQVLLGDELKLLGSREPAPAPVDPELELMKAVYGKTDIIGRVIDSAVRAAKQAAGISEPEPWYADMARTAVPLAIQHLPRILDTLRAAATGRSALSEPPAIAGGPSQPSARASAEAGAVADAGANGSVSPSPGHLSATTPHAAPTTPGGDEAAAKLKAIVLKRFEEHIEFIRSSLAEAAEGGEAPDEYARGGYALEETADLIFEILTEPEFELIEIDTQVGRISAAASIKLIMAQNDQFIANTLLESHRDKAALIAKPETVQWVSNLKKRVAEMIVENAAEEENEATDAS